MAEGCRDGIHLCFPCPSPFLMKTVFETINNRLLCLVIFFLLLVYNISQANQAQAVASGLYSRQYECMEKLMYSNSTSQFLYQIFTVVVQQIVPYCLYQLLQWNYSTTYLMVKLLLCTVEYFSYGNVQSSTTVCADKVLYSIAVILSRVLQHNSTTTYST